MTKHKYCEGCFTYHKYRHICTYIAHNDNGECPCSICIIKVMCNKPCDDITNFKKAKKIRL